MVKDGFTLASPDKAVRDYWIEHGKRCREIGEAFYKTLGKELRNQLLDARRLQGQPHRHGRSPRSAWLSRWTRYSRAAISSGVKEAVESKVFGLGVESYTVGSHELMMGYAITRNKLYCLDAGHFHPTEVISNKISVDHAVSCPSCCCT